MTPFFLINDNWSKMLKEVSEWNGTPYHHLTSVKGAGVDCTLLIGELFVSCGILSKVVHDDYKKKWYLDVNNEVVLESFERHFREFSLPGVYLEVIYNKKETLDKKIDKKEFVRGDVLTFSTVPTKVTNHAGIWMGEDNLFFNSIERHGAKSITYGSFWKERLTRVFRIMKI